MHDDHQRPSGIAPGPLALAALASAVATLVIARFGLTGTVIGAALTPVLVALVMEAARRPVRRIRRARTRGRRPGAAGSGRTIYAAPTWSARLAGVSWRRVVLTGLTAFALVVGAFTVADFGLGDSVASDRKTTFFDRGKPKRAPAQERPQPAATTTEPAATTVTTPTVRPEDEPEETVPTTETATTPTETAPATTTTTTDAP